MASFIVLFFSVKILYEDSNGQEAEYPRYYRRKLAKIYKKMAKRFFTQIIEKISECVQLYMYRRFNSVGEVPLL